VIRNGTIRATNSLSIWQPKKATSSQPAKKLGITRAAVQTERFKGLCTNDSKSARERENVMFWRGKNVMNEEYRGFNLYGGCEPYSATLLGHINQWKPTGCIAFKHSNGVISELTRFRFPMTWGMTRTLLTASG